MASPLRLLLIGDGERDAVTVPCLVERILGADVEGETDEWARLHEGKGYGQKLRFAIRSAKAQGLHGLVVTLDRDKAPKSERLRKLKEARDADRHRDIFVPTAVGEARPHGEAWLLDDQRAVREALGLPSDTDVPTGRRARNPKTELLKLLRQSPRRRERPLVVFPEIAKLVELSRCPHAEQTGFQNFSDDVVRELGSLAAAR